MRVTPSKLRSCSRLLQRGLTPAAQVVEVELTYYNHASCNDDEVGLSFNQHNQQAVATLLLDPTAALRVRLQQFMRLVSDNNG